MTDTPKAAVTVILVHGAWADGSSWRRVIPLLQARGISVVAVQNPTTSLGDDVTATRRAIDLANGPVILVGHSWGGTVITEAGNDPRVKGLIYVTAFAPEAGQSSSEQGASHPPTPGLQSIERAGDDWLLMSTEGWISNVAQDLPESEARVLASVQPPLGLKAFGEKITTAAWSTLPTWYVVATEDRSLAVDLQHQLAAKLQAKTTTVPASHMVLLSQPEVVAGVIAEAVKATTA